MNKAISDVIAERERQQSKERWSTAHDDQHTAGELARAAACYAYLSTLDSDAKNAHVAACWGHMEGFSSIVTMLWPDGFGTQWLKPKDQRQDLVRAAALLIAEIERVDRDAVNGDAGR